MECTDLLAGKYDQLCLCYEGTNKCSKLLAVIEAGLDRLCTQVPWIAGYSVRNKDTGEWDIVLQRAATLEVAIRVATQPDLKTLRHSTFSTRWFDERLIAPCATFSQDSEKHPVFLAQLNAIQNGVMLVFCAERNSMDIVGLNYILRLLNKACLDETISASELAVANSHRSSPVEPSVLPDFIVPAPDRWPDPDGCTPGSSPPQWFYFGLQDEREVAQNACRRLGTAVSTDDVIAAFLYRAVAAARAPRLPLDTTIRLARATDSRTQLNMHPEYPGSAQQMLYTEATIGELLNEPLHGTVLRMKATSTANPLLCRDLDPHRDLSICNWSACEAYEWTFGLDLGRPLRVVRPTFMPVESVAYILPANPANHRSPVALCLTQGDHDSLKKTACYIQYACDGA